MPSKKATTSTTSSPSSRPKSTSQLSQAPVTSAPLPPLPQLTSFNESNELFASVTSSGTVVGRERLRVWEIIPGGTTVGSLKAEWDLEMGEKVTAIQWIELENEEDDTTVEKEGSEDDEEEEEDRPTKKQKQDKETSPDEPTSIEVVVVLTSSTLSLYTPTSSTPLFTSHLSSFIPSLTSTKTSSNSGVTSLAYSLDYDILAISTDKSLYIFPTESLGAIRSRQPLLSLDYSKGFTAPNVLTFLPLSEENEEEDDSSDAEDEEVTLLLGSLTLSTLTFSLSSPKATLSFSATSTTPQQISVSPLTTILPLSATQIITAEEDSRIATLWKYTPSGTQFFETISTYPIPTLSPIHSLTISSENGLVAILSQEGSIHLFPTSTISSYFKDPLVTTTSEDPSSSLKKSSSSKKSRKSVTSSITTFKPISNIEVVEGKEARMVGICGLAFVGAEGEEGKDGEDVDMDASAGNGIDGKEELIVGRIGAGGRVVWEEVNYLDEAGNVLEKVVVKRSAMSLNEAEVEGSSIALKRFTAQSIATTSSINAFTDLAASTLAQEEMALPVEGELADMTLGDRMAVLDGGVISAATPAKKSKGKKAALEDDDDEDDEDLAGGKSKKDTPQTLAPQTTQSLTRLLSQALHTSDQPLLSLILTSPSNSSQTLVRNTVRKLPASLALPLLKACVERLGRGRGWDKRGGGRGGGVGAAQGRGVVNWIRGVLVERGSVLMTIPSLPVHLANLSQLLDSRLQLQQPLLSLSGRLDLALAQIEMRKSLAAAQPKQSGTHYVEGESESSSDDDDDEEEVPIEVGEEDGEIEEVRMESLSRRESGDEDEDDDEFVSRRKVNGKSKGKGKVNGKSLSAMDVDDEDEEEDDEDDEGSSLGSDEDDDEEDFDDDDDSDAGGNGFIDDEASEAGSDESESEMEE